MDTLSLVVGLVVLSVVVASTVLASRAQATMHRECSKLDGCPLRQEQITDGEAHLR
jgi:hypothetical protein